MRISKTTSRLLALLMAAFMLFGMIPVSAFAAEETVTYTEASTLENGKTYVIVENGYAMTSKAHNGYRNNDGYVYTGLVGAPFDAANTGSITDDMYWKVSVNSGVTTIQHAKTQKYLAGSLATNSYSGFSADLTLSSEATDALKWTVNGDDVKCNDFDGIRDGKTYYLVFDNKPDEIVAAGRGEDPGSGNLFGFRTTSDDLAFYEVVTTPSTPVDPPVTPPVPGETYEKIAPTEIAVGKELVIVAKNGSDYFALANNGTQKITVAVDGDTVTVPAADAENAVWTVGTATGTQTDSDKLSLTFANNGTYIGRVSQKNNVVLEKTNYNTKYFGHVVQNNTIGNFSGQGAYYGLSYGQNPDNGQQVQFYYGTTLTNNITFYAKSVADTPVAVTGVTLNKETLELTVGGSETLTATVAPADASDKTVTWASDKTDVATVDATGKVTAVAAGTANITATAGGKTAKCVVTVKAATVAVTGVTLNKETLELTVGGSETLTATVAPADASDKTVTWASDKTDVATVDATGKITAVAAGTANITATAGGKTAKCVVTVKAAQKPAEPAKVTTLKDGKYIIVSDNNKKALTSEVHDGYTNTNNYGYKGFVGADVTIANNKITSATTADMVYEVKAVNGGFTIMHVADSKYLTASYVSNGSGGYTGTLTLSATAETWEWESATGRLKSTKASQNDRGSTLYLTFDDKTDTISTGSGSLFGIRSSSNDYTNVDRIDFYSVTGEFEDEGGNQGGTTTPDVPSVSDEPTKVTTLKPGNYVIVNGSNALTTKTHSGYTNSSNYAYSGFEGKKVTISGNKITDATNDLVFEIKTSGSGYTIKHVNSNKYLTASYVSNNNGGYTGTLTLSSTAEVWEWNSSTGYLKSTNASTSSKGLYLVFDDVNNNVSTGSQNNLFGIRSDGNNGDNLDKIDFYLVGKALDDGDVEDDKPTTPSSATFVAFTSDVHNNGAANSSGTAAYRLNSWLNNVSNKVGGIFDTMAFCGDNANAYGNGDTYWNNVQIVMDVVSGSNKVNGDGIFINGNHEWENGQVGTSNHAAAKKIKNIGYVASTNNYAIYVFGAASSNQGFNQSDITNLGNWLNSTPAGKPIFILSHFPLHKDGNRDSTNKAAVISTLNQYADKHEIYFLWGHNHTNSDPKYDEVITGKLENTTIGFTYLAAGCMSDSEYSNGSASVKGKGLVATIDDGKVETLTYYAENANAVYVYIPDHTETPDVPAHQHSPSTAWTSDATYHWHTCSGCTEQVDKAEHTWDAGVVTVEPTLEATGTKTFTCEVCSATKTEEIPVLVCQHEYSSVIHQPTCTEAGYIVYTCALCEDTYTETRGEALGHEYVDGVCSVCGEADPDVPETPEEPETPENPEVALKAPEIVSCYSKLQTSVKVTWTPVEDADGYELWRTTTPDDEKSWTRTKTVKDGAADRYTNQDLQKGTTYYYKVRAYVEDAEGNRTYSDFSNVDYMPAAVVWDAPYSNATFRIRLRWNEIDGAHGYQIWRLNEDGETWSVVKTLGDKNNTLTDNQGATTAYSNTGLTAGKNYVYKMRAFTIPEEGRKVFGAFSNEFTIAVMPEAPVITVTSPKAGRAQIDWKALNGAAGYQVWMNNTDSDAGWAIVKSVTDDSTTYTKYDLKSGTTYEFRVRAYTEVNGKKTFGAYSEVVTITVK